MAVDQFLHAHSIQDSTGHVAAKPAGPTHFVADVAAIAAEEVCATFSLMST